jgi:hypothetical protein
MFCQNCGSKQEAGAKFCAGCGKPVAESTANASISIAEPLEEKVFWNNGGILVSDVVFRTNLGASYPIRNISSVSVALKPASSGLMLVAIVLTLFGLFMMFGSAPVGFVFLLLSAPFWYMVSNRSHQLLIGAGGVLQTAIESTNSSELDRVAKAINDSILYIQRA